MSIINLINVTWKIFQFDKIRHKVGLIFRYVYMNFTWIWKGVSYIKLYLFTGPFSISRWPKTVSRFKRLLLVLDFSLDYKNWAQCVHLFDEIIFI